MVCSYSFVMAGLVPAIHAFKQVKKQDVDARNKRGHDGASSHFTLENFVGFKN
jgi:hypothetical protein